MSSTFDSGSAWDRPLGCSARTCAGCGRASSATTCLACALQTRFTVEPSAFTVHRGGSAPAPVVAVQVAVAIVAIAAGVVAVHSLPLMAPLSLASLAASGPVRWWAALLDLGVLVEVAWLLALFLGGLWAVNALHRGSPLVRVLITVWPVLDLIALAVTGVDALSRAALAVHLILVALLWAPDSARRHFQRLD